MLYVPWYIYIWKYQTQNQLNHQYVSCSHLTCTIFSEFYKLNWLTCVESLEANVISKFPFNPSKEGTKIKISETCTKTSVCCNEAKFVWQLYGVTKIAEFFKQKKHCMQYPTCAYYLFSLPEQHQGPCQPLQFQIQQ